MRIHVTYRKKNTTISVDDVLIDYLGAWYLADHPELHKNAERQLAAALGAVRRIVKGIEQMQPDGTLSSQVQRMIIEQIAKPGLAEIIKARGPLPKKDRRPVEPPEDLSNNPVAMAWLKASEPGARPIKP